MKVFIFIVCFSVRFRVSCRELNVLFMDLWSQSSSEKRCERQRNVGYTFWNPIHINIFSVGLTYKFHNFSHGYLIVFVVVMIRSGSATEPTSLLGLLTKIECGICSYQLKLIWYTPDKGVHMFRSGKPFIDVMHVIENVFLVIGESVTLVPVF